ncbi:MAG: hypothetical protein WC091_07440 [Sulfuricellaceae bacterium]
MGTIKRSIFFGQAENKSIPEYRHLGLSCDNWLNFLTDFGLDQTMSARNRSGNNPKRRVIARDLVTQEYLERLTREVRYIGSGNHKRHPANYGFAQASPRPTKSLCDANRVMDLEEAQALIKSGISKGMFSNPQEDGLPKYIWSVSDAGEVFEAKTHPNTYGKYHGYPLEDEDDMRDYIFEIWRAR